MERKDDLQALKHNIDAVVTIYNQNFQKINESIQLFVMGIDYRKYLKFKSFVPATIMKSNYDNFAVLTSFNSDNVTIEDLNFGIDF